MIFFSQTPEVKALKCINLDRWTFFSLLYMNWMDWGVEFLLGFEAVCKVPLACYVRNYKMSWLQTPDRSPPFKHFWSKQKSEHDLSSEEKIPKKSKYQQRIISTEIRTVTVILYLTLFLFYFCFIKRSSCFMIFLRSDSGDTGFQRLTTIPL